MNIPIIAVTAVLAAVIMEALLLYLILPMLLDSGAVGRNYQGIDIPVSVGLTFPMAVMGIYFLYAGFGYYQSAYQLFLLSIVSISFLGFIDDILGKRDTLGFKGHFGALFKGRLTTGGLKALGGGMIALFVAFFLSAGFLDIVLNTLILALFTNMLNLLDLRPGRAIKGFLFFLIILLLTAAVDYTLLAPLLGAVLCYFYYDLKARAMMGDAGSNVLGFALGYLAVSGLELQGRVIVLVFLILMHIYTEKYSLTKTIENNKILKYIDQLGR